VKSKNNSSILIEAVKKKSIEQVIFAVWLNLPSSLLQKMQNFSLVVANIN
jgi:hypothetical protein